MNSGTDTPPVVSLATPQTETPTPWREFGQRVLAAHHRQGLGAQCICDSLMHHCPVIAAAQRLGLPTDDPRGRGTPSPVTDSRQHTDTTGTRQSSTTVQDSNAV